MVVAVNFTDEWHADIVPQVLARFLQPCRCRLGLGPAASRAPPSPSTTCPPSSHPAQRNQQLESDAVISSGDAYDSAFNPNSINISITATTISHTHPLSLQHSTTPQLPNTQPPLPQPPTVTAQTTAVLAPSVESAQHTDIPISTAAAVTAAEKVHTGDVSNAMSSRAGQGAVHEVDRITAGIREAAHHNVCVVVLGHRAARKGIPAFEDNMGRAGLVAVVQNTSEEMSTYVYVRAACT